MKFEEFKELDKLNAYGDYRSIKLAKMSGEIPSNLHDYIEDTCKCGSDRITNGTTLTCCSPRCYIKLGHRLSNLFSKFGVKNLGPSTCIKIMDFGIKRDIFVLPSHIEIFNKFKEFEYILGSKYYDLTIGLELIHSNSIPFYKIVQSVGIPGFDSECINYFKDIENSIQLKEELNKHGVVKFMSDRGVYDLKKSFNLVMCLTDIYIFEKLFRGEVITKILKDVRICLTGPVYPNGTYMKRDEFVRYLNSISKIGSVQLFNISESGASTSSYVIADSPSNSRKYLKAKEREYYNPNQRVIYTSTEIVELIEKEVMKCKELTNIKE